MLIEDEGITHRGLFIIDPQSVVRYQVVHDGDVGRSVDEALRVLQALRAGARFRRTGSPASPAARMRTD